MIDRQVTPDGTGANGARGAAFATRDRDTEMTDPQAHSTTATAIANADATAQWAATTDYVRVTAQFLNLPLDEGQVGRVASHLVRTRAMAAMLQNLPIDAHVELAEIYRPAPFPQDDATDDTPAATPTGTP